MAVRVEIEAPRRYVKCGCGAVLSYNDEDVRHGPTTRSLRGVECPECVHCATITDESTKAGEDAYNETVAVKATRRTPVRFQKEDGGLQG